MTAIAVSTESVLIVSVIASTSVVSSQLAVRLTLCALVEKVSVDALSTGVVARNAVSAVVPVSVVAVAESGGKSRERLASKASVLLRAVAGHAGVEA